MALIFTAPKIETKQKTIEPENKIFEKNSAPKTQRKQLIIHKIKPKDQEKWTRELFLTKYSKKDNGYRSFETTLSSFDKFALSVKTPYLSVDFFQNGKIINKTVRMGKNQRCINAIKNQNVYIIYILNSKFRNISNLVL